MLQILPMILMTFMPYILFIILLVQINLKISLIIWLILFFIIIIFNVIYAFRLPILKYNGQKILFWNMLLKLFNIPIYIFIFLTALILNIFIIPLIPILFLFDYILLLSTSMYGISGILKSYKDGIFSKKTVIINVVLQFFFCFDVISALICYFKSKKNYNKIKKQKDKI